MTIEVIMKNGEIKKAPPENRSGGSWRNRLSYEGSFLVITDVWENQIIIPASDIKEVKTSQ